CVDFADGVRLPGQDVRGPHRGGFSQKHRCKSEGLATTPSLGQISRMFRGWSALSKDEPPPGSLPLARASSTESENTMAAFCTKCGAPSAGDTAFCTKCGA